MTIATEYAKYCADLEYGDLPEDVVGYTKNLIQDHIGVAVGGGHYSPQAAVFIESVRELNQSIEEGATVLATGERMLPTYAAMLNGTLAHSLDYDDMGGSHPGACIIPATLAAGEQTQANGRDLIRGIVAGYEVMFRLGEAVNQEKHYNRGFHPTATCGLFGATAAVSSLLNLSQDHIEHAFGLNVSQVSGNHGYIRHGGWNKRLHPGMAAKSAIIATTFAKNGFQGTRQPFEGYQNFFYAFTEDPKPELATKGLGEEYKLFGTGFKLYPSCGRNHTAIDLTVDLVNTNNIDHKSIESIRVEAWDMAVENMARPEEAKKHPSDIFEAQFSLPFSVALAAGRGEFRLDTLVNEMRDGYGNDIQRLMDLMTIERSEELEAKAIGSARPVTITITIDSDTYRGSKVYRNGDPKHSPPTQDELDDKFKALTSNLTAVEQREVLESIAEIEDRTINDLIAPFGKLKDPA